jgi:hypothetical protein
MRLPLPLLLLLLVGCMEQIDQRWELDHEHVVAVRATPPSILPGQRARLDALLAHADTAPSVGSPIGVAVGVPEDDPLFGIVSNALLEGWFVTAPDEATLAAVRARDGLPADAPVPVPIVMAFPGPGDEHLYATKTVYLGASGDNPSPPAMAIDGQPAADQVSVPMEQDIYVSVNVESGTRVNWLTSCGSLFQDDVATAFLRVLDGDETEGHLAVVIRDARGGVAWRVWPIRATR